MTYIKNHYVVHIPLIPGTLYVAFDLFVVTQQKRKFSYGMDNSSFSALSIKLIDSNKETLSDGATTIHPRQIHFGIIHPRGQKMTIFPRKFNSIGRKFGLPRFFWRRTNRSVREFVSVCF